MLRPYRMSKVIITGPKEVQERVIKELYKLKILHIVEHSKNELADIGKPFENAAKLSELLVKTRALSAALNVKNEGNKFELKRGMLEISQTIKKLNEEAKINFDELKKTEDSISKNHVVKQELEILKGIDVPLESFEAYKSLAHFTGYLKDKNNVLNLKKELSKATDSFILFSSDAKKNTPIALFIDRKSAEYAANLLQKIGFATINLTSVSNFKGTALSNLKKIENETSALGRKKEFINKQIRKLCKEYGRFLIKSEETLVKELEKAEAPLKFATTSSSFLIKGWIPTDDLNKSMERLNRISKNKIFIHSEDAQKKDSVPVKLNNKDYVKPFEFFINLYTMPAYKEIDPTFFIFLTFPLLFGFMLGDFGYGLVTLTLFMLLRKFVPKFRDFFNILIFASLATIFFGLLFGEFFGLEEIFGFHLLHILSRSHQINELMILAIAVGVIHINLGLAIGFINELKSHGFMSALYSKGGWFVLEAGVALLALSYFNVIILPIYVGIAFFLLALFMLFKGEGVRGLIEFPGIFSNTLSYARLMAIGLSSVKLAEVINESATEMFHEGGFLILAGVLILAIGHVINIILGSFGSFLHSLRLHYVEFFTKFFHGGAKKFSPFGSRE